MRKWITIGIGMGLLATAACATVNDDTALSRTPIPTKDVNTITCGIEPDRNEVGIYRYRVFCRARVGQYRDMNLRLRTWNFPSR